MLFEAVVGGVIGLLFVLLVAVLAGFLVWRPVAVKKARDLVKNYENKGEIVYLCPEDFDTSASPRCCSMNMYSVGFIVFGESTLSVVEYGYFRCFCCCGYTESTYEYDEVTVADALKRRKRSSNEEFAQAQRQTKHNYIQIGRGVLCASEYTCAELTAKIRSRQRGVISHEVIIAVLENIDDKL